MFDCRKTVPIDQIDPGPPLYPTDGRFISHYQQYLLCTLNTEQSVIALEGLDPHSGVRPIVHPEFVAEVDAAIDRGEAPMITVYPQNGRFVMSDDYDAFFAYQALKCRRFPVRCSVERRVHAFAICASYLIRCLQKQEVS